MKVKQHAVVCTSQQNLYNIYMNRKSVGVGDGGWGVKGGVKGEGERRGGVVSVLELSDAATNLNVHCHRDNKYKCSQHSSFVGFQSM